MVAALNVILDLDNTIINTLPIDRAMPFMNEFWYSPYKHNSFLSDVIIARPNLDEFLDWLFKNCKVSVFTHADKEYAMYIVNTFILQGKKDRKIDTIYYRYHVEMAMKIFGGYKDLRLIWDEFKVFDFYPSNTIIIDDNPIVKKSNPYNTIQIYPFDASSESVNDNHLLKVKRLLQYLTINYNKDLLHKGDKNEPILKKYGDNIDEIY
jgi:TFIIF-interacting CTD phosphatase-like protein